jgi:hypothetical protein
MMTCAGAARDFFGVGPPAVPSRTRRVFDGGVNGKAPIALGATAPPAEPTMKDLRVNFMILFLLVDGTET